MDVLYKTYSPNIGLEIVQAKLYNDYLKRNLPFSPYEISAKQIEARIRHENRNPLLNRYAFQANGSPLAYIQASISGNTSWIGFPYATEDCPKNVQEQLFSHLFRYIQENYPNNEIVMGYFPDTWIEIKIFAQQKGFHLNDENRFYHISSTLLDPQIPNNLTLKQANLSDLDALIELSEVDLDYSHLFSSIQTRKTFFEEILASDLKITFLRSSDQILSASMPLKGFFAGILPRFIILRPDYEALWQPLMHAVILYSREIGWEGSFLYQTYEKGTIIEPQLRKMQQYPFLTQVQYKFSK